MPAKGKSATPRKKRAAPARDRVAPDDPELAEIAEIAAALDPDPNATLAEIERGEVIRGIVGARIRGLSEQQVAATFGVPPKRVRQVLAAYRQQHKTLRHRDPLEIVDEMLERYEGAVEELALISATSDSATARVAAVKARLDAVAKSAELLQAVGVLPRQLGELRVLFDVRMVAERWLAVLSEEGVDERVVERLFAELPGQAKPPALR